MASVIRKRSASSNAVLSAKRKYSGLTLKEVMQLVPAEQLLRWQPDSTPIPPSDTLRDVLRRLEAFDLTGSEQAKTLLIDAIFVEVIPPHTKLKVWKAATLETDTLTGIADYLMAPRRAYIATPLLCATEAKRDDFEQGQVQCIAEMIACRWNNQRDGHDVDVFGIVSNGQGWQFYRLSRDAKVYETELYAIGDLPRLLGILDSICVECERSIPD